MPYDNTNKGAMFKNDRKATDKHPDYKGSINVDGVEYWISGWINVAGPQAKNPGSKYMSLQVQPKEEQDQNDRPPKPLNDEPIDDDIPF